MGFLTTTPISSLYEPQLLIFLEIVTACKQQLINYLFIYLLTYIPNKVLLNSLPSNGARKCICNYSHPSRDIPLYSTLITCFLYFACFFICVIDSPAIISFHGIILLRSIFSSFILLFRDVHHMFLHLLLAYFTCLSKQLMILHNQLIASFVKIKQCYFIAKKAWQKCRH